MSASSETAIQYLAREKKKKAVKEYTDTALANPDLNHPDKIKLLSLNQDNRLEIIKRIQKHTLENVFKKFPDAFFTCKYHYDWWSFPMTVPREWNWPQRNYDASIDIIEAINLMCDEEFVETYLQGLALYMEALATHGWNNYPVRYARMLNSMALFMQASSQMEGREAVYENLYLKAQQAIDFAEAHVIPLASDYDLLLRGAKNVLDEMEKYKENSSNFIPSYS